MTIDLSQFRQTQLRPKEEEAEPAGIDLNQFRVSPNESVPEDSEGLAAKTLRNVARGGLTGAAAIGGLPETFASGVESVRGLLPEGVQNVLDFDPLGVSAGLRSAAQFLPSQETLMQPSKFIASKLGMDGYFDAKNPVESFYDEVITDIAIFATPVGGAGMSMARAVGTSLFSNLSGELTQQITGSEGAGTAAKIGTMFLGGFTGKPSAKQFATELLNDAENVMADYRIAARPMRQELNRLERDIMKGANIKEKEPALDLIRQAKTKFATPSVEALEVRKFRKDVGRVFGRKGLDKLAKAELSEINVILDRNIKQIEKNVPGFSKMYEEGLDAFAAVEKGSKSANWLTQQAKKLKAPNPQTLALLSVVKPGVVGAAGAGLSAVSGLQVMQRVMQSPALRRHYLDLVRASATESSGPALKALNRLNKGLAEEEED